MSKPDVQRVKEALIDAGVEIYRTNDSEIQIAERVRLHIMDSGVRVRIEEPVQVLFTARSQRSDFPNAAAADLFDKVRSNVGSQAQERGYEERDANTIEVKDPVNDSKVLDVWHEVTYTKALPDESAIIEEVNWALEVEKYVAG